MKKIKIISILILSFGLAIASPIMAEPVLTLMSDSVNSGIINTKIMTDHTLSNIKIDATVVNGIAIFKGTVYSKEQLEELLHIAHSVSGIRGVDISKVKVLGIRAG